MTEKRFLELAQECGVGIENMEIFKIYENAINFSFKGIHDPEKCNIVFRKVSINSQSPFVYYEIAMLYVAWLKEIENEV